MLRLCRLRNILSHTTTALFHRRPWLNARIARIDSFRARCPGGRDGELELALATTLRRHLTLAGSNKCLLLQPVEASVVGEANGRKVFVLAPLCGPDQTVVAFLSYVRNL